MAEYIIYRYVCNGETIYVGKTIRDLRFRVCEHSVEKKFLKYLTGYNCDIEWFNAGSKASMDIYEKYLINNMSPILNEAGSKGDDLPFVLPYIRWNSLDSYKYNSDSVINELDSVSDMYKRLEFLQEKILRVHNSISATKGNVSELLKLFHFLVTVDKSSIKNIRSRNCSFTYFSKDLPKEICIFGNKVLVYTDVQSCEKGWLYTNNSVNMRKILKYGLIEVYYSLKSYISTVLKEVDKLNELKSERCQILIEIGNTKGQ